MLSDHRFIGKNDRDLTRLGQYKVLEVRKADELSFGNDNVAFLCTSDIKVTIDCNVEAHLDRAIELNNRTNQLNFTKKRLPEETDAARRELQGFLRRFDVFAGLIKVRDRYGDYGYAGFFAVSGGHHKSSLEYFCFSCRLMNMGVESWVYRRLGHPYVQKFADISYDFTENTQQISWISVADDDNPDLDNQEEKILDRLVLRGGCDLDAISHYLAPIADECYVETNTYRDGRQFRIDNAAFLRLVFEPVPPPVAQSLLSLGYKESDWSSALARP